MLKATSCGALMAFVLGSAVRSAEVLHQEGEHLVPTGKGFGQHDLSGKAQELAEKFSRASRTSSSAILYHGGPVMHGPAAS